MFPEQKSSKSVVILAFGIIAKKNFQNGILFPEQKSSKSVVILAFGNYCEK